MSDPNSEPVAPHESDEGAESPADDTFDEIREAAGAVIASLKWFIDATERVVEDPANFSRVVENGRAVVAAFADGFVTQARDAQDDPESTAHGEDRDPQD